MGKNKLFVVMKEEYEMGIGDWILEKVFDGITGVIDVGYDVAFYADLVANNIKDGVEEVIDTVQDGCTTIQESTNMFNVGSKNEALRMHREKLEEYHENYKNMMKFCDELYAQRMQSVVLIKKIEKIINTIANKPKEFEKAMGKVHNEIINFNNTEKYAEEAYDASVKSGKNMIDGSVAGLALASMGPRALMGIATTFGTASTGTAISALSGVAAEKAAVAWLGRTFAGFAVKEGAGMVAGNALLGLIGPIGWGITATTVVFSAVDLSKQNKNIAENAIEEAKQIVSATENLKETITKEKILLEKTKVLYNGLDERFWCLEKFKNTNYKWIRNVEDKKFLGLIVNDTETLSKLVNENIK